MKRPHRRVHLMMWIVLAPVTIMLAVYFWTMRPVPPEGEFPAAIQTSAVGER